MGKWLVCGLHSTYLVGDTGYDDKFNMSPPSRPDPGSLRASRHLSARFHCSPGDAGSVLVITICSVLGSSRLCSTVPSQRPSRWGGLGCFRSIQCKGNSHTRAIPRTDGPPTGPWLTPACYSRVISESGPCARRSRGEWHSGHTVHYAGTSSCCQRAPFMEMEAVRCRPMERTREAREDHH